LLIKFIADATRRMLCEEAIFTQLYRHTTVLVSSIMQVRQTCCGIASPINLESLLLLRQGTKELTSMGDRLFALVCSVMFMLGMAGSAVAQDNGAQQPSARQQLQQMHAPRSFDQELDHLTKDLELTPQQQQQVRPLLEEHHNRIQALLDKNPNASRQELGPQIHAISEKTHREIHALLTDHQKQLEKAMQQRGHKGEENKGSD
jgi:hypothetical protein